MRFSSLITRQEYGQAYQEGFPVTIRFLLARGIPGDAAEECAQAAWSRGWERIHQLRDREFLKTWVNSIALNIYRRSALLDSRRQTLSDCAGGPEIDVAAIDLARLLDSCSESDRVLLQHQLDGLSTCEMATAVGASEAAVRIRLMRARRSAKSIGEARAVAAQAAAYSLPATSSLRVYPIIRN
jgi:DNA-directed RNA polymerase specialized sigma24 family protein